MAKARDIDDIFKADPVSFSMKPEEIRECDVCKSTELKDGAKFWVRLNKKWCCCEECEFTLLPHLRAKREASRKDPDRFKGITTDHGFVKQPKYHNHKKGLKAYRQRMREQDHYAIKHGPSVGTKG